jgi:hypothetical protein
MSNLPRSSPRSEQTNYPAACNAAETLLIHSSAAPTLLEPLALHLISLGVTLHCDEPSYTLLSSTSVPSAQLKQATPDSFTTEYLALEIAVKIVPSLESAIEHMNEHGSHHTDCIVTESEERAEKFMREVDSAGVYWNASTRFADGFRYGFGAEIGVRGGNAMRSNADNNSTSPCSRSRQTKPTPAAPSASKAWSSTNTSCTVKDRARVRTLAVIRNSCTSR